MLMPVTIVPCQLVIDSEVLEELKTFAPGPPTTDGLIAWFNQELALGISTVLNEPVREHLRIIRRTGLPEER